MKKIALLALVTSGLLYGSFLDSVKEVAAKESTQKSESNSLLSSITGDTGLSLTQASGTVGTLMQYAQSNMSSDDYKSVTKAAPLLSGLTGTPSMTSSLTDSIVSNETVASSLKALGVEPSMVKTVIPMVVDYATSSGGEETGSILSKSLSGLLSF